MVSNLIRLRYRLMINGFRRSVGSMIGGIFSVLGYLYMVVMTYILAFVVAAAPVEAISYAERGAIYVLVGAVALIVWIIAPILFSATSPFTDPKNFLVYGIPNKQFIPGIIAQGIVAPTGIGTFVLFLTGTIMWGWHPAAIIAGIIAAALGTVMCVVAMYVVVGLLNNVISKRIVRDALQMVMLIPIMLAGFILLGAIETIEEFWDVLPEIVGWVAFTPLGFLALPGFVAQGSWLLAGLHVLVMLTYLGLGIWCYHGILNKVAESAGSGQQRERTQTGLGLIGKATSPMTAVWARSLLYWIKDPRYAASLLIVGVFVIFGVLETTVLATDEFQFVTQLIPVFIAYLLAFSISADLSYDSTGFSLHVTSGVRGIDDRLGRVFALLTWALPITVLLTIAMVFATDNAQHWAAWLGMSIGVLLSGTALSAVVSARYIYPVPPPGASLMAQPEGGMGRIMIVQTVGMLVQLLLALPVAIPGIIALVLGSSFWGIITLMVGVLYGVGILWGGVKLGAAWYDRALPETYQSIVKVAALY